MVFQARPLLLSLRKQIAPVLRNPLQMVMPARKKEAVPDALLLMATYTEAANKFTKAAMEIMEYARLLTAARNTYLLGQKEGELARLQREIDSLRVVIPLLVEDSPVNSGSERMGASENCQGTT